MPALPVGVVPTPRKRMGVRLWRWAWEFLGKYEDFR